MSPRLPKTDASRRGIFIRTSPPLGRASAAQAMAARPQSSGTRCSRSRSAGRRNRLDIEAAEAKIRQSGCFTPASAFDSRGSSPHERTGFSRVQRTQALYQGHDSRANTIAQALIDQGTKKNLSPSLLIGILLTENAKLDPQARSNVSARGLMQVMPFHAGKWKGCTSNDLADIASNICYGTSILAEYIRRAPSLEKALLNYNGCVRGTNTPEMPHVLRKGSSVR